MAGGAKALWESHVGLGRVLKVAALLAATMSSGAALGHTAPAAGIAKIAPPPLVRVNISESLRPPPDQASISVGTQAKAETATAAVAANKVKTEKLLASI